MQKTTFLAAALLFASVKSLFAQPSLREQLALELACVAVHEGAFENYAETALIWQVLETRAHSDLRRLALLRRHSPRALGLKPSRAGNSVWSVELLKAPEAPPASIETQKPGWWRNKRAALWERVRRYALELVYGVELWRPCPGPGPWTWGFAGDWEGAIGRGLRPMGCTGVNNDGFTLFRRFVSPQRVVLVSAEDAAGSR